MSIHAHAYQRPPLPTVERYRLADDGLFQRLDPAHPGMAAVLRVYETAGVDAGKAALAGHFRARKEPYWGADPRTRTTRTHTISNRERVRAENALKHFFDQRRPHHQFGEEIDWLDNPTYAEEHEFDKEWSMGFLRMPWWTSLGEAYWATGDEKYAREIIRQFLSFRRAHPIPTARHGWLPSHPLKYKVPEWRTLETSIRIRTSWSQAFFRLLTSPSFTDEALTEMLKAFWEMGNYLRQFTRVQGRTNNWTTSELLALHTVAALFPEFQSAGEWRRYAVKHMWNEFEKQVYPDGVQWELAPGYGMGVTKQFRALVDTAELAGDVLPEAYMDRLEGMYHYFLTSSVAGRCAAFGDSGHGAIASIMRLAARDFPERADFHWAASNGTEGAPPREQISQWPWAGQYAMRSGWEPEDRFMIIDAGPYGVSHQNEDFLSYELYAYGDWLIPDPGSYRYNYDSPWRRYMTGSLSHNTLVVDHQGQNRHSQRDLWIAEKPREHTYDTAGEVVYFQGTYNAGYGNDAEIRVDHTRSVFFIDGRFWIIFDRARPHDEASHRYETLMMLNSTDAQVTDTIITTTRLDGPNILIAAAPQSGQTVEVTKGQIDPVRRGWRKGGKTVVPNPTAAIGMRTAGAASFAILLYPLAAGAEIPTGVRIEWLQAPGDGDAMAARIVVPGHPPLVVADRLDHGPIHVRDHHMEGRWMLFDETP